MAALRTCVRGLADDRLPRLATVYRVFHLSRSSTTTSASYFTGAQHGVARYPGNFERVAWLLPLPPRRVPRRQRKITVLLFAVFSLARAIFLIFFSFVLSSPISLLILQHFYYRTLSLSLYIFRRDHAFARICTPAYSPSSPFLSCCICPSFFYALPSASPTLLHFAFLLCFFSLIRVCSTTLFLSWCTRLYFASRTSGWFNTSEMQ